MKKEISEIKERNRKVEMDKSWETSLTRKILITSMTYIVIVVFLFFINAPSPLINAVVPTIGFILSTQTLSIFKKLWLRYVYEK